MKKQYLIGLLSLVAISIPLGNSLLSSTNNQVLQTNNNAMVYDDNQKTDMAVTKQPYDITETSASIDYDIDLYLTSGIASTADEINTITWYEDDSRTNELASKDYAGVDDVNKTQSVVGTLVTDELAAEETYNTVLVLDYQDAKADKDKEIEEIVTPFVATTEATIDIVIPGLDNEDCSKGCVEETAARVEYTIKSDSKPLTASLIDPDTEEAFGDTATTYLEHGTHSGAFHPHYLTPDTTYHAEIYVTFADETQNIDGTYTGDNDVDFTTLPHEVVTPTITPTLGTVTETSAKVSYKIVLGEDIHDNSFVIKKVEWIDIATGQAFGKTTANTDGEAKGNFTAEGLTPNTTYNTIIDVTYIDADNLENPNNDQHITKNNDVKVTTVPHKVEKTSITTTLEEVTDKTAEVTYEIDPGKDSYNEPFEIVSVEWIDTATGEAFGKTTPNEGDEVIGEFTATGLSPLTTYETKINVTFVDETQNITKDNEVKFITIEGNIIEPTIALDPSKQIETTLNSVTFNYVADVGEDAHNLPYYLAEVKILDGKESMGSIGAEDAIKQDALPLKGTITIDGLESGTTYEGWIMEATFIDTGDAHHQTEISSIGPFKTLKAGKDGPGWWAIILTILTVLIIFNFVLWLTIDLYIEFKAKQK